MKPLFGKIAALVKARPDTAAVLALAASALALRAWPFASITHSYEDAYFYLELARSLAAGRWGVMGEFHTQHLPGFPAAITVMRAVLLGQADWFTSAQAASLAASAAIPALCYLLGIELTGRRTDALAAGIIAALNARLAIAAGAPWPEAVFAFQVIAVLVLIRRFPIAAGAVAGWAALTAPEGLLLAGAFALAFLERRNRDRAFRLGGGLGLMLAAVSWWWAFHYLRTGILPWEAYAQAFIGPGRVGPAAILLAFPTAGHLAVLFALPGLIALSRKTPAWPAIWTLAAGIVLYAWRVWPNERMFTPLVPIVCVLAGAGAGAVGRMAARPGNTKKNGGPWVWLRSRAALGLALAAGLSHYLGFLPGLVKEETSRTAGYYEAVQYLALQPGNFTVIAYDALMVGYHSNRPVIAFGAIAAEDWKDLMPELFFDYGARYILWSDLFISDLAKDELGSPDPMWITALYPVQGIEREIVLDLQLAQEYRWISRGPEPGWARPWRKSQPRESAAFLFSIRLDPGPVE